MIPYPYVEACIRESLRRTWIIVGLLLSLAPEPARAATYYVSPAGADGNPGSEASPFASWARAQTAASPGDTIYFRGGTYKYAGLGCISSSSNPATGHCCAT